jgi:FMN phosphatase YigB (HAD superfamily)
MQNLRHNRHYAQSLSFVSDHGSPLSEIADFLEATDRIKVISTDVFDTLLLRNVRSERSRIMMGERLFSFLLAQRGWNISADVLFDSRLRAQRLAFRGLVLRGIAGEVRLVDIIERQLVLLGLPKSLVTERIRIELQIEKRSLVANERLASVLRARKNAGARIVAVSDTTLPAGAVRELITHFHGSSLVDHVYSSADEALTKRDGGLFVAVAKAENVELGQMVHLGDDLHADVKTPLAQGITVYHTPRHAFLRYLRAANGALTEAGRVFRSRVRSANACALFEETTYSFGHNIFGPIVTQFCLMIWLYAAEIESGHKPVLMFCARGGIGIREAFERTLIKFGLQLNTRRETFMISRLVAARAALLARSGAAIEELNREFRGSAFAEVAEALGGRRYELPDTWRQPFCVEKFISLLESASGADVLADIEKQNAFFTRHFLQLSGDAERIILCDTGLYGSTQRLLASAFPNMRIETIQFARANYKGHGEEHFPKVTGLMVERNCYSPLDVKSCILRYWHLIESLFEPAVPSVRSFTRDETGAIAGNCGDIRFGAIDPTENNALLSGALSYIDAMPAHGGAVALRDAEVAWRRLKRAIARPTQAELSCLEVGGRSVDFGRPDIRQVLENQTFTQLSLSLKKQLWREGAISRQFPLLKHAFLPLFATVLSLRGLLARQ